jgi:hypothetical protein
VATSRVWHPVRLARSVGFGVDRRPSLLNNTAGRARPDSARMSMRCARSGDAPRLCRARSSHRKSGQALSRDPRHPGGARQSRRSSCRTGTRPAMRQRGLRKRSARRVPRTGVPVGPIRSAFACPRGTTRILPYEGRLAEQPRFTALAIVGRLSAKYSEEFGKALDCAASAEGAWTEGCRTAGRSGPARRRHDHCPIARGCGRARAI